MGCLLSSDDIQDRPLRRVAAWTGVSVLGMSLKWTLNSLCQEFLLRRRHTHKTQSRLIRGFRGRNRKHTMASDQLE